MGLPQLHHRPGAAAKPPQTAVWHFADLPIHFAARKNVRCEFNFAIYRASKGQNQNRGISCSFTFQTWRFDRNRLDEYRKKRKEERGDLHGRTEADVDNDLAKEFGYYEIDSFPVENFHTMSRDLPGGLFENAAQTDPQAAARVAGPRPQPGAARGAASAAWTGRSTSAWPATTSTCARTTPTRPARPSWFAVNFFKGATGLWMRLVLVIGVATALSTYLSNVISLLVALMLYVGGLFRDFISSVVIGKNVGGGPLAVVFRRGRPADRRRAAGTGAPSGGRRSVGARCSSTTRRTWSRRLRGTSSASSTRPSAGRWAGCST